MTTVTRSALTGLYEAVGSQFETRGICAKVYLGLKERDRWDETRVVIIDGEFDGSNTPRVRSAGEFRAPGQKASYNPRELVQWVRPVTLSIRAYDPKRLDDECAQTEATECLIEQTIQCVWNAVSSGGVGLGQANVDFAGSKAVWVDPGTATQQSGGKEFLVGFLYKTVLFDVAYPVVTATPALEKGPLLTSPRSGVNASVLSASSGTATIANLGFCTPSLVGQNLVLSGAASSGNNGTFPIAKYLSPTRLVITNAAAVAPDASNGAIVWAVQK